MLPKPRVSTHKIVEEVLNSSTHGIGAIGALVALPIVLFTVSAPVSYKISFAVYAVCLVILMIISALYHALKFTRAAGVFRTLDLGGIFLLIAGTFTPFIMVLNNGLPQWVLLSLVWSLAVVGIVLRATLPKHMNKVGVGIFISLGWLGVIFFPKLIALSGSVFLLVAIGGLLYTTGAILLASKKPFIHMTWHIMVVAAAIVHFIAVTKLTNFV